MTKQTTMLVLLACLLNLSAGVPSMADEIRDNDSQKCISTRTLTGTRILDDRNVLFFRSGNTVYHNILPKQCAGLSRSGLFSYGTMAGSICERDSIRVIDGVSGTPGNACLLGLFRKITNEDVPTLFGGRAGPVEPVALPPADVEDVTGEAEELRDSTTN